MPDLRVFISYSHDDAEQYRVVRGTLVEMGLKPCSDEDLSAGGAGFDEQIQRLIAHSHVFVPIITPNSHALGWVHQEIGYAVAMHVPVVPVCSGQLPAGMIQMAQAIVMEDVSTESADRLRSVDFRKLATAAGSRWLPFGECAHHSGERAALIDRHASEARQALGPLCVRQGGGLSSFRIPDERPGAPVWRAHYGTGFRGDETNKKLRGERQALTRHAEMAGCKLIIHYGDGLDEPYGPGTASSRLRTLVEYLHTMRDDLVEIALVRKEPHEVFLAVGNWFLAESYAARPVRGIEHTLFSTHAPTIDRRIDEFDQDVKTLIRQQGTTPRESRSWAIEVLTRRINELPRHPEWP